MSQSHKNKRDAFPHDILIRLEEAWEDGMASSGKGCQSKISAVSEETGLSEIRVKNWIGNRRARDVNKRNVQKPRRKTTKQGPNSYSLFARTIKRGSESGSSYLKTVSTKWSELPTEEKSKFKKAACKIRSDPTHGNNRKTVIKEQLKAIRHAIYTLESVNYHVGGYGVDETGDNPVTFFYIKRCSILYRNRKI